MQLLGWLLFPFAVLYSIISRLRNYLYDRGLQPSVRFDLPVINVGNVTVGGTGKTPHVEYLASWLKSQFHVAILSRGYGRSTKGFRLANEQDSASTLGDEPMQYFQKFGQKVAVAVGEERTTAIPSILFEKEETELILLDDAYQHRKVRPSFNILLCNYHAPFYNDYLLPTGRLRDNRSSAKRAEAVIVSKCPTVIPENEKALFREEISKYTAPNVPVYFTAIQYGEPVPMRDFSFDPSRPLNLISGIANDALFKEYCHQNFKVASFKSYNDHHRYTQQEVARLTADASKSTAPILMTEKDAVKWKPFLPQTEAHPLFYLPIEVAFLDESEEKEFQENLLRHIENFRS